MFIFGFHFQVVPNMFMLLISADALRFDVEIERERERDKLKANCLNLLLFPSSRWANRVRIVCAGSNWAYLCLCI